MQLFDAIAFAMMLLGPIGLIVSIIVTVNFLSKRKTSSTAWKLSAAAIVSFILGAGYTFLDGVVYTWWNVLGPVGGYILIVLASIQHDKDSKSHRLMEKHMIQSSE